MIECDPSDPDNFSGMGNHFYSRCRYKEAIECYEKAIELDPSNSVFWTEKGEALYRWNKFENALQCFDKAIELNPSHPHPFEVKAKPSRRLVVMTKRKIFPRRPKNLRTKSSKKWRLKYPRLKDQVKSSYFRKPTRRTMAHHNEIRGPSSPTPRPGGDLPGLGIELSLSSLVGLGLPSALGYRSSGPKNIFIAPQYHLLKILLSLCLIASLMG
jgi:tetratricopeptide (TPR) repeat protein